MINISTFTGRLTKDPELRKPAEGHKKTFCYFQLAVERSTGETDFPEFVCYSKMAEYFCKNARKGDLVAVEAKYRSRFNEHKKYHDFVVKHIEYLNKKEKGEYDIDIPQSDKDD